MPVPAHLEKIVAYAKDNGISYECAPPQSFTSSVRQNLDCLVVQIKNEQELSLFLQEIQKHNQEKGDTNEIVTSVIGGGRGGNNNSYSINKLWNGTDVFIQLVWEPTFVIKEQKHSDQSNICRISPNIMLIELNQKLFEEKYHCETLCGCLPFMSFAGGLSTNSHTSFGFLADIVEGIEVILPNGLKKYFEKGSEDFNLFSRHPSLGLLGVITAIDIVVKPGRKKLKRTVNISSYGDFIDDIQPDEKNNELTLHGNSVLFSSIDLNNHTPVKLTKWEWVDYNERDRGTAESQIADSSIIANYVAPQLAASHPRLFSRILQKSIFSDEKNNIVIARPNELMSVECKVTGHITEMGLLFDFDKNIIKNFLQRLSELFKNKQAQNKFPVNTAIFIRFPQKIENEQSSHQIAIDFASLGLDLEELKPFVSEVMSYLSSQGITSSLHYGKSDAISLMSVRDDKQSNNWEHLKGQYRTFYERHELNQTVLNKKIVALEQQHPKPRQLPLGDQKIVQNYLEYCNQYEKHLKNELEEQLQQYPICNQYDNYRAFLQDCTAIFGEEFDKYETIYQDIYTKAENKETYPADPDFKQREMMNKDKKLRITLEKYNIIKSLKLELNIDELPNKKIENFHRVLDQQTKSLNKQRDHEIWKWLGVFTAGLLGCVVFSYWSTKYAYASLFKTKSKMMLLDPVTDIREGRYHSSRSTH